MKEDPSILESRNISFNAFEKLLRFCTSNSYFEFNGHFYNQTCGGPMGYALTVELAERRIQKWERDALTICPVPIDFWKHYVDDMLACTDNPEDSEKLFQFLDNLEPDIKLKKNFEINGEISFLDILFSKSKGISVYRKPTHTDRYINYKSCHPQSVKDGIIHTLINRAKNYCSNDINFNKEMSHINHILRLNNYPQQRIKQVINNKKLAENLPPKEKVIYKKWVCIPFIPGISYRIRKFLNRANIGVSFSPGTKLKQILSKPKSKMPLSLSKNVVYKIQCECDKNYAGMTTQHVQKRLKQHKDDEKYHLNDPRLTHSTAEHALKTGHMVGYDYAEVVDSGKVNGELRFKEALVIRKLNCGPGNGLNKDYGKHIPEAWLPFIPKIKYNSRPISQ